MQIVFHIGAHCTDDERLMRSLLRNRDRLAKEGIVVPGPGRYRTVLRDVVNKLRGEKASQTTQDVVLESIMEQDDAERIVLSNDSFICLPGKALENGELYTRAHKAAWLRNTFPDNDVEFALGIRNPATFIPALYQTQNTDDLRFHEFLGGLQPTELFWSDYVERLREAVPDCRITVWCNEDTPLIWPEVMREVSGHDPYTQLIGGFDILYQIMQREGVRRLRSYLGSHPPANEITRRRILAAFLDKFAIDDEIEEEIDLPGWSAELIETLTEAYEDDLDDLAHIPNVTLITP